MTAYVKRNPRSPACPYMIAAISNSSYLYPDQKDSLLAVLAPRDRLWVKNKIAAFQQQKKDEALKIEGTAGSCQKEAGNGKQESHRYYGC
jgi:hypothetical protein